MRTLIAIITLFVWGCTSQPAEEAPKAETPKDAVAALAVEDAELGKKPQEQRQERYLAATSRWPRRPSCSSAVAVATGPPS